MTTSFLQRDRNTGAGTDAGDGSENVDDDPRSGDRGGSARRLGLRARVFIAVAVLVVLALVATWVIAFSSLFGVRSVDVRGEHELTASQVEAAAGIGHGTPLVRVDTAGVTRRVETLPGIASAEVSTEFPSTVVITVVERTAVGYIQVGGKALLVDRTGAQYRTVAAAPHGLPRMVVPTSHGRTPHAASAAVARVASSLPRTLLAQVHSIQALDPTAITLVLSQGRLVQWGSATANAQKARVLPVIIKHRRYDTVFDVSDPNQPFSR